MSHEANKVLCSIIDANPELKSRLQNDGFLLHEDFVKYLVSTGANALVQALHAIKEEVGTVGSKIVNGTWFTAIVHCHSVTLYPQTCGYRVHLMVKYSPEIGK